MVSLRLVEFREQLSDFQISKADSSYGVNFSPDCVGGDTQSVAQWRSYCCACATLLAVRLVSDPQSSMGTSRPNEARGQWNAKLVVPLRVGVALREIGTVSCYTDVFLRRFLRTSISYYRGMYDTRNVLQPMNQERRAGLLVSCRVACSARRNGLQFQGILDLACSLFYVTNCLPCFSVL
jgi:hypothetical protein